MKVHELSKARFGYKAENTTKITLFKYQLSEKHFDNLELTTDSESPIEQVKKKTYL